MGFKLKDSAGGVQNTHTISTKWGISQDNQRKDKHSLAAFQDEKQKTNHLKCMYTNAAGEQKQGTGALCPVRK